MWDRPIAESGARAYLDPITRIIAVPYHFGREHTGVGLGPSRIAEVLAHPVEIVRRNAPFSSELQAIAAVNHSLSVAVAQASAAGEFPLVLAGNCNCCLGALEGIGTHDTGIVWFDAHGDFNTPETSLSGSIDGMALAIATGRCHRDLWRGTPVCSNNVVLAGTRDLDPAERAHLEASEIRTVAAAHAGGAAAQISVPGVYVHVDLDVLNREESPGVSCMAPGGVSFAELKRGITEVAGQKRLRAAAIANFNPAQDIDGRTLRYCFRLVELFRELTL